MVDTGDIVAVKRFPILSSDDVGSLLLRTYDFQLALFYEVVDQILSEKSLPSCGESWTREPFTRKEFNALKVITPSMSAKEISRRIKATSYGIFQPSFNIDGHIFELKTKNDSGK